MPLDLLTRAEEAQAAFDAHKDSMGEEPTEHDWNTFDDLADASSKAWDRVNADARAQGKAPAFAAQSGTLGDLAAMLSGATADNQESGTFYDSLRDSDTFKAFAARSSMAMSLDVHGATVADFDRSGFAFRDGARNDLTWSGDPDKQGGFIRPDRQAGITDLVPVVGPRVRSLVTNLKTSQAAVEWLQVTGKAYGAKVVPEAQSADPIGDGTGGTTTALMGGQKPYNDYAMSIESTTVKTIPVLHNTTESALDDIPGLLGMLRAFMGEDVRVSEDWNLMQGDGGPEALDGLLGSKWNLPAFDPTGNTDIDAVLLAIGQILNAGSYPTAIVTNPIDWLSSGFLLAKDTTGNYILGNPRADAEQLNSLWGLKVVTTPTVPQGTMIVGDFRQSILWDRQMARFKMTNSHKDHFERNIIDMRLEQRLAFGVRKPSAFQVITA